MVRALAQQLRPLLVQLNSFASGQAFAQYAVPAVAAPQSGGLFGGKRVTTPLSDPLAGVLLPNVTSPKAPELKTGSVGDVKAAALDVSGPNTCVALFVGGGSSIETEATAGASKLLEYMAFSATNARSSFRVARELEKYGAASSCIAGREHIAYVVEGTCLQTAEVTELLLDAAVNQKLADWEVRDMLAKVEEDLEEAYANPSVLAHELLHKAAFSGGLSNPLLPDPASLHGLTGDVLREYVASVFTSGNMAVTAAGVPLSQLQQVAGPMLQGIGSGAAPSAPASKYTGGFLAALSPGAEPTLAVAFEAKGGLSDVKATATAAVVKALLGAGSREAVPYSGKGMEGPLTSVTPLVQMYKSTGLIGLMGTTTSSSSSAAAAADALTQKLQALTSANEASLAAAKQLALGGYQSAISAKAGVVQDMGLQLLSRGKFSAQEYASAVAGLTAADVSKYAIELVKSPLTLVAVGGISSLPKYDTVAGRLKA